MPFQFVKVSKDDVLAVSTRKLYRALLNKISREGFTTQDELIAKSFSVIKFINELYSENHKKRIMMSAIFYILCDTEYIKSPNPYYDYFQTIKSAYISNE